MKKTKHSPERDPETLEEIEQANTQPTEDKLKREKEQRRVWKEKNKHKWKYYQAKYKKNNLEKVRKKNRNYYYKNKDKIIKAHQESRKSGVNREKYLVRLKTSEYPRKKYCELCSANESVAHHHFTNPYHQDFYVDLCKECHIIVDKYDLLVGKRIKSFYLAEVKKILIDRLNHSKELKYGFTEEQVDYISGNENELKNIIDVIKSKLKEGEGKT